MIEPNYLQLPSQLGVQMSWGGARGTTVVGTRPWQEGGGGGGERGRGATGLLAVPCMCEGEKLLGCPPHAEKVAILRGQRRGTCYS